MGLAKTATPAQTESNSALTEISSNATQHFSIEGVPIDVAKQFGVDPWKIDSKDRAKLKDIWNWANDDNVEESMGDILLKIRRVQSKLGMNSDYNKVWNFIKMDLTVRELRKRQQAMVQPTF